MIYEYIDALENEFANNTNHSLALKQKAYVRGQFEFYGLITIERRMLQKPFLVKEFLPKKHEAISIIKVLWEKPQREYHHFSQELAFRYINKIESEDIELYEYMITHKSWWDTVDFIANKLMGAYFIKYPDQIERHIDKWLKSDSIWLKRSALLFQLKYKTDLDKDLLAYIINSLLGSKGFFINKAIGWVLREYGYTNPKWVLEFVTNTDLSTLSKREALRLIKKEKKSSISSQKNNY
ncbi:MAG: DNA alkylation repair protein [Flavobacteriaceae bacterium]|nr:DNA alkylation repair protein [Flavobacteriaceae bacterium]